ncbi:heme-binding protein [Salmonella enterica]|nr:heme-binding protein [Salmonella enterica]EKC2694313.1 heme-binding protein [Salmonella enterica]
MKRVPVDTALNVCHSENKTGVVTVVDKGGRPVALQRDDKADPHNTLAARKKACSALSTKSNPGNSQKRAQTLKRKTEHSQVQTINKFHTSCATVISLEKTELSVSNYSNSIRFCNHLKFQANDNGYH